jgi:hypothetical protein
MKMLILCLNTENKRHNEWPDGTNMILFFPGSLIRPKVATTCSVDMGLHYRVYENIIFWYSLLSCNMCVYGVHYHWSSCECMDCIVYAYRLFHAVITECLRKMDTAWKTNI